MNNNLIKKKQILFKLTVETGEKNEIFFIYYLKKELILWIS